MITLINKVTNDRIENINNTTMTDGKLWYFNKSEKIGNAWLTKYPMFEQGDEIRGEGKNLKLEIRLIDSNWDVEPRKPRKSRKSKNGDETKSESKGETRKEPKREETKSESKESKKASEKKASAKSKLANVFSPEVANTIVETITEEVKDKIGDGDVKPSKVIRIELPNGKKNDVKGITHKKFDRMVKDIAKGYNVYMYGPAGTGKSHTARQIADALGLKYYQLNQVEFAHEVAGYGDASGRYVPTPLYEACVNGGLLFFDEIDRSAQQATTVVNTLLANGSFNFPVVGNVKAHPDFRVVAAGNTTMSGASNEYVAANVIDASTRDRFVFYEVYYDREIELGDDIAQGDVALVDFMEDIRGAVKKSHVELVASMRATRYLKDNEKEDTKDELLKCGLFKGMPSEDIRIIYNHMTNKGLNTEWGIAMGKLC